MKRALLLLVLTSCAAPRESVYSRSIDDAIDDGVDYLVETQSADGSWGKGLETTDHDVMASVSGSHDAFRVGATALCVQALREAGERKASARGLKYLTSYDGPRRANRAEIYNIWAHLYALETLARAWREDKVEAYKAAAERHLKSLEAYETYIGGWNYYDFVYGTQKPSMEPVSFGTAAGLVALHEARKDGLTIPEPLVQRALARLREMKNPDGSFLYGSDFRYVPNHLANRANGSLGRTQSCYYALRLWGDPKIGDTEVKEGLERLIRDHRFIEIGRKRPMPHEACTRTPCGRTWSACARWACWTSRSRRGDRSAVPSTATRWPLTPRRSAWSPPPSRCSPVCWSRRPPAPASVVRTRRPPAGSRAGPWPPDRVREAAPRPSPGPSTSWASTRPWPTTARSPPSPSPTARTGSWQRLTPSWCVTCTEAWSRDSWKNTAVQTLNSSARWSIASRVRSFCRPNRQVG